MNMKLTLAAMAMALPMMLAPAADARDLWGRWTTNQVRIEQSGTNNGAAAAQNGVANRTTIVQNGHDNLTQATQNGVNNNMRLYQTGVGNTTIADQQGNNNSLCLHQAGSGLGAEITQTGNQNGAYIQTNRGVARMPGMVCR